MKYKAILFDLDGTLLPQDPDLLLKIYFKELTNKMSAFGYQPQQLLSTMWKGVAAMQNNDGTQTNEKRFWDVFSSVFGPKSLEDMPKFEEFYSVEYGAARAACSVNPMAAQMISRLKQTDARLAVATAPLFPEVALRSRVLWSGCNPDDFDLITTYENSHFAKPNPLYYTEIAQKMDVSPSECLMVGNDTGDDLPAEQAGMDVFLLTDCLINDRNIDVSSYPHGGFEDLAMFLNLN